MKGLNISSALNAMPVLHKNRIYEDIFQQFMRTIDHLAVIIVKLALEEKWNYKDILILFMRGKGIISVPIVTKALDNQAIYGLTFNQFMRGKKLTNVPFVIPDLHKNKVKSVHEKKKNFKCSLCDFATFAKSNLKQHIIAVHEGMNKVLCTICGETKDKSRIQEHIDVVEM